MLKIPQNIRKTKKTVSLILSVIAAVSTLISPINSAATYKEEERTVIDDVVEATSLLEKILNAQYERKVNEAKEYIKDNGYDYALSVESITEQQNPLENVQFLDIIAAYLCTDTSSTILDVEFFDVTYEESSTEVSVPYKYDVYKENEDGYFEYSHAGYLMSDGKIPVYKETENGFVFDKMQQITVEKEEIKFLNVGISVYPTEELLDNLGASDMEEFDSRLTKMQNAGLSNEGLSQSAFLLFSQDIYYEEFIEILDNARAMVADDPRRIAIIDTAASLIGRVPYEWGGKSTHAGYDDTWYTITEEGKQKGLDCSGYVSWVYQTVGYSNYASIISTGEILNNTTTIDYQDLLPGDIGVLNDGSSVNHTGIYLGNGYWIHCSSSARTVTINNFNFTIYKRINDFESINLSNMVVTAVQNEPFELSDEEFMLLCQTVSHEAKGEGLNGWAAVAEVILNRLASSKYGEDISSIVYAEGQFEGSEYIINEVPSENLVKTVKAVVDGNLRVLDDTEICYFRNAYGSMDAWNNMLPCKVIGNHTFYK